MDRIRQRISGLPRTPLEVNRSLQLLGSLRRLGWHRSLDSPAVGSDGEHIPWWCYPALHWILPKIQPTDRVLEYGGGASSVWFDRNAGEVVTVEDDPEWASWIRARCAAHLVEVPNGLFDVVVVDGGDRAGRIPIAAQNVKPDGALIVDNVDFPELQDALHRLEGWHRVDFAGNPPGVGVPTATGLLFRDPTRWTAPRKYLDRLEDQWVR